MNADVIVVGTGPSGVHAAAACHERGKSVLILDIGNDDAVTRGLIPAGNFAEIRRSDEQQARYLVGDHATAADLTGVRVGAQLTPPREFITRDADRYSPVASSTFSAMRSFALGGLGAGWGAGSYSFNDRELSEIGLPPADVAEAYNAIAAGVGIAAAEDDDTSAELTRFRPLQPPHPLDTNAAVLFSSYGAHRDSVRAQGMTIGRAPSAILSRPIAADPTRQPNPYDDMDFYSDASRSVYRPRYTLERLLTKSGVTLRDGAVVTGFAATPDGVEVAYLDVHSGERRVVSARRLVLAAGAIGSSRIALRSVGYIDRPAPILSNAYAYLPCVNLTMLGRPAETKRHSLAQLSGVFSAAEENDAVLLSIFSYRSLLLFKLVKEMPLPPSLGLLTARLLMSSLTIVGVHQPDRRTPAKTMRLLGNADDAPLQIAYDADAGERRSIARRLQSVRAALRTLGCLALGTILPGSGSSIHYAGALTITEDGRDVLGTSADGRMHAAPFVYVADSANWRFLPAKGLTMTLMANARRVAGAACDSL